MEVRRVKRGGGRCHVPKLIAVTDVHGLLYDTPVSAFYISGGEVGTVRHRRDVGCRFYSSSSATLLGTESPKDERRFDIRLVKSG